MTSSTEFHWNQKGRIALSLLKDKIGHVEVSIWKVLYIILDIQLTYLKFQNNTVYRHLKTLLINVKKNCKTLAGFKLITCKSIANALTYCAILLNIRNRRKICTCRPLFNFISYFERKYVTICRCHTPPWRTVSQYFLF